MISVFARISIYCPNIIRAKNVRQIYLHGNLPYDLFFAYTTKTVPCYSHGARVLPIKIEKYVLYSLKRQPDCEKRGKMVSHIPSTYGQSDSVGAGRPPLSLPRKSRGFRRSLRLHSACEAGLYWLCPAPIIIGAEPYKHIAWSISYRSTRRAG